MDNKYFIRWREITPELMFTPRMLIPFEHTYVFAPDEKGAKKKLRELYTFVNFDRVEIDQIELCKKS